MLKDEDHFTTIAFVSLMENGERDFYFNRCADGRLNKQEANEIDLDEFALVRFGSASVFFARIASGRLPGA